MKGIKTQCQPDAVKGRVPRSDHCPAMKGIKTAAVLQRIEDVGAEATTAPQ